MTDARELAKALREHAHEIRIGDTRLPYSVGLEIAAALDRLADIERACASGTSELAKRATERLVEVERVIPPDYDGLVKTVREREAAVARVAELEAALRKIEGAKERWSTCPDHVAWVQAGMWSKALAAEALKEKK